MPEPTSEQDVRTWPERAPAGAIGALEFLLLAPASAYLVLVAIPRAFGIESSCVGPTGSQQTSGDTYIAAFVLLGAAGWLGSFVGVLLASLAGRRGLVMLVPLAWAVVLVLAGLTVAALVGAVPCPS